MRREPASSEAERRRTGSWDNGKEISSFLCWSCGWPRVHPSASRTAHRLGAEPPSVSRWLARTRSIGEKSNRKIEPSGCSELWPRARSRDTPEQPIGVTGKAKPWKNRFLLMNRLADEDFRPHTKQLWFKSCRPWHVRNERQICFAYQKDWVEKIFWKIESSLKIQDQDLL